MAAQQALERRDYESFDDNLEKSKQVAETLRDEALRAEFRADLALMGVEGAYWRGDVAKAEQEARRAIEILEATDPADRHGKLCSARVFLGDILLDTERPAQAAQEFRLAASMAERNGTRVAAIFPLQRLSDALLEEEKRAEAVEVIDHCVEIENEFFAGKETVISMTAPDQSLVRADFETAERLFEEKVRFFDSSPANSADIDVLRYRLHLAEAQRGQGSQEKARATLMAAYATEEMRFGAQHPRAAKVRRRLESIPQ